MAKVVTDSKHYTDIANAIREKTGGVDTFTPANMAEAIASIAVGSPVQTGTVKFIAEQDTNIEVPFAPKYFVVYKTTHTNKGQAMGVNGVEALIASNVDDYAFFIVSGATGTSYTVYPGKWSVNFSYENGVLTAPPSFTYQNTSSATSTRLYTATASMNNEALYILVG